METKEREYLRRSIDSYRKCSPKAMAYDQSRAAIFYAIDDLTHDVISLYEENEKMRKLLQVVACPRRGTEEENMTPAQLAEDIFKVFPYSFFLDD
jgi:hypothetical protein